MNWTEVTEEELLEFCVKKSGYFTEHNDPDGLYFNWYEKRTTYRQNQWHVDYFINPVKVGKIVYDGIVRTWYVDKIQMNSML